MMYIVKKKKQQAIIRNVALLTAFFTTLSIATLNAAQNQDTEANDVLQINSHYAIETLDPAIAYDWLNYELISTALCQLVGYATDETGNRIFINEVADSYTTSDDKKTYTFKLKENWYFSNGKNVQAKDVKQSFERTLTPEKMSPANGYFAVIQGYDEYAAGIAKEISGVQVIDTYTVSITLKQPQQSFLTVLTTNFAGIVDVDAQETTDFNKTPISCGLMYIDSQTDNKVITKLNPYHPYKDTTQWKEVIYNIKQPLRKSIVQLVRNDIDLVFSKITTSDGLHALNVLKPESQKLVFNDFNTIFIAMNTNLPPFDNLKVRQAMNMAINKQRISSSHLSGTGVVANQIIPPGMLGHIEGFKAYEFDVEKAQQLMQEAGYARGFSTEMLTLEDPKINPIALSIKEDLAQIGVRVKIKTLSIPEFLAQAADPQKGEMIFSEGIAWVADFPHPSNFYYPLLNKDAFAGGWNWSFFYDDEIEQKVIDAESRLIGKNAAQIDETWGEIFADIMRFAPWIPLYHNTTFTLKSENIKFKEVRPMSIHGFILQPFGLNGIYREKHTQQTAQ